MAKQKKESASNEIQEALKALDSALKKANEKPPESIYEGSALKVEDIYLPLNHLFNAAAKKALKRSVKELNPKRKSITSPLESVTDTVRYFGASAMGERQIFDAARKVAHEINRLAEKGFVTGALTRLSLIKLASEEFELDRYAIISFVAITQQGLAYLRNNPSNVEMLEGETPKNLDEIDDIQTFTNDGISRGFARK